MGYQALLFCPDEKTARTVTQVLSELEFNVESCSEPFAAVKRLMGEHFDAIVVDCDNEQNATLLFKSARTSTSNQASLAVAVVEGQAGVAKAFRIGANLVLTKPINVEQSKGTLRVARGLLRKTDAAKPASATSTTTAPPQSAVTNISTKRPSAPQIPDPRPASASLPAQPSPSPIPAVSASVFEVEADPAPEPEPAEAALLESMPAPVPPSTPAKEYPWQPISKPAAEPMATALRRAAEATGRSQVDSHGANKIAPSAASRARSYTSSMASGQAAAAAPAKISQPPEDAHMPPVEAPAFASLGGASSEHASGSGKKTILIAAVLVAVAAVGYIGWTKMQPVNPAPAQKLAAPAQIAPPQVQAPTLAAVPPPASPAQDIAIATTTTPPQPTRPVEQGPDIVLSTTNPRPPAAKKSASIVASDTVVRTPSDANAPAPMVVKNQVSNPVPPSPAQQDSAPPPAPGSLGVASNASDQAISGIMSTTATNLPQQPPQKLRISQGVSQGLLIKSIDPIYPALARQMRIQGAVELLASIGKDGSITGVKLLSGDSVLSRAAIDAVKQWKYKPYYLNDQPVEIQTQVTVKFKLP